MFSGVVKILLSLLGATMLSGCLVVTESSGLSVTPAPRALTTSELRTQANNDSLSFLSCGGVIVDAQRLSEVINEMRVIVRRLDYLQFVNPVTTVAAVNRNGNGLPRSCTVISPRVGGERKGSRYERTDDGWEVQIVIWEQPNGFLLVYVSTIDAIFVG